MEINCTRISFKTAFKQTINVWDLIKLSKFKTMTTWMKKTKIRVGEKVVKLLDETQLLA